MPSESDRLVLLAPSPRKQADQKFCHACGCLLHVSAANCTACGAPQSGERSGSVGGGSIPNHVFCRGCGQAIHQSAPVCPHCGAPQRAVAAMPRDAEKSRGAAVLLALFLGGLGAHKFYLGEIALGILYLLFCWTFIPAFVALIEALVYLCMSNDDFARKYG
jgi:TM2 domain-containing membrane protein YozV/RNA polymerase subunit RPABC4/transcription elongation factor Spt4